jgi:hypothetical protein
MPTTSNDPVVDSRLQEFAALQKRLANADVVNTDEIVEGLCRLSRDIRLRLGHPRNASPVQVKAVMVAFESAVKAIEGLKSPTQLSQNYCANIRTRLELISEAASEVLRA